MAGADASVSLLGLGFLVWGSLRIFRGLDTAFSDIYETGSENTFADQLIDGLLLLATVAIAIVAVSVVGGAISVAVPGPLGRLLDGGAVAVGLFVVFYPMYYVFPDTDVTPLEVVPGVAFAAVGLTVAQAVFTAVKAGGAGENLVASILFLLTWLYVSGLIVLLGAVVNAVLSNRSEDVSIQPVVGDAADATRERAAVDRTALLSDLDALADRLDRNGDDLRVSVGDDAVDLVAPQSVTVDRETGVFGLDDSVSLTLRWWPDEE
ncbi:YhjD/YihY/BrkB family envelope integrity protein [Haloarcula litorea]|uniref:YhjD/YihY/BrkB family envelope integrity protein n=1 Tax=Haloarcula litorea TaxID=3032579 RepID=UPI0023E8C1F6|nr:YhjD/YihY/BrkB family envelope integrity protein [Halomicroarcula sp. GDY20]